MLVLEPWRGGSHALFLDQWCARSRHAIEVRGLAPRSFRWRMRASAWRFARDLVSERTEPPDALFVTSFVDLPGLFGFLPGEWAHVPVICYFHENQLTYPRREHGEAEADDISRDLHLAFTQVLSCLRADALVFNSRFHLQEFADAARAFLARLPDGAPRGEFAAKLERAAYVVPPGVDLEAVPLGPGAPVDSPLRVLFNQRWEWDKDPQAFVRACNRARERGARFEVCLLGERAPPADAGLADVVHCGFEPDRAAYLRRLGECDVVVSTARHEFFGLAVAEALAAGCTPLLPDRLSYPELLGDRAKGTEGAPFVPWRDERELVVRWVRLATTREQTRSPARRAAARARVEGVSADETARLLDEHVERLAR